MWLVDKLHRGLEPQRESVPPATHAQLIRWYVGHGTEADEKVGVQLVRNAKMFERWIACDCLGAALAPPLLSPAYLSEAETYYLRRLTGEDRPEHHIDCPFFCDQAAYSRDRERHNVKPLTRPDGFFAALKPMGEHLAQQPIDDADDNRIRSGSVPRLARLLWNLMDLAAINIVEAIGQRPRPEIRLEFDAIRRAAGNLWIAPGRSLSSYLFTHPDALRTRRIYAKLREAAATWPDGHEPQAFLLLYARTVTRRVVDLGNGDPIVITSDVVKPPQRMIDRGPYLVLIAIGQHPQARGLAPVRAYAQPVLNGRQFIPVDSNAERHFLSVLLDCQWKLHDAGIASRIKKPLFDLVTDEGPCRPDFMIDMLERTTQRRRLRIAELTGYENDRYRASKARTIPIMEHIAPMTEYAIDELDDDDALRARILYALSA